MLPVFAFLAALVKVLTTTETSGILCYQGTRDAHAAYNGTANCAGTNLCYHISLIVDNREEWFGCGDDRMVRQYLLKDKGGCLKVSYFENYKGNTVNIRCCGTNYCNWTPNPSFEASNRASWLLVVLFSFLLQ